MLLVLWREGGGGPLSLALFSILPGRGLRVSVPFPDKTTCPNGGSNFKPNPISGNRFSEALPLLA
jgi:hypothetical protein